MQNVDIGLHGDWCALLEFVVKNMEFCFPVGPVLFNFNLCHSLYMSIQVAFVLVVGLYGIGIDFEISFTDGDADDMSVPYNFIH